MGKGTGVTAEELEKAILQEAQGGPTKRVDDLHLEYDPGDEADYWKAVDRYKEDHPEVIDIEHDDHGICATVRVEPCPKWVTMYIAVDHLGRNYGGPEEGGWWYDSGDVVHTEAVRVFFNDNREPYLKEEERKFLGMIAEKLSEEFTFGTSYRSSVRPRGSDFSWRIEWDPPRDWPYRKPHYE